jgi:hypothetical protein
MNTPQERAGEEFEFLDRVLARKPEREQIELLTTSVRAALLRKYAALEESSALRAKLGRMEALFQEASRRNEATVASYRASLERTLAETRAQCEDRMSEITEELEKARIAVVAAQEERDLLFATIVQHIMTLPPIPLLAEPGAGDEFPALVVAEPLAESEHARAEMVGFRDETHACSAIRALLGSVGLEGLWTLSGPTREADLLRNEKGAALPTPQRILLLAAFDLWNGQGGVAFVEVAQGLPSRPARTLLTLTAAASLSPTAVDRWLSDCGGEPLAVRC